MPTKPPPDRQTRPSRGTRRVRLFRNGRNQAVRIPREFQLPGDEALLTKEGNRLVLEPVARPSLLALLATWEPLDIEFPEIDDPLPKPDDDPFG